MKAKQGKQICVCEVFDLGPGLACAAGDSGLSTRTTSSEKTPTRIYFSPPSLALHHPTNTRRNAAGILMSRHIPK